MDFSKITSNLTQLGYSVHEFNTSKEATDYLAKEIFGQTVGIGGSVTVKEMKLYEALEKNNEVYWHNKLPLPEGMTDADVRTKEGQAAIYISSVNGIAETGEIVNIDRMGNRVSSISYGHKKVYLVVGENKIESDYERALYRARNVAAPLNAQRLNRKTPCAVKADKCYDCKSPDRLCKNLSVLWGKPMGAEYEVVLIHERLGY